MRRALAATALILSTGLASGALAPAAGRVLSGDRR